VRSTARPSQVSSCGLSRIIEMSETEPRFQSLFWKGTTLSSAIARYDSRGRPPSSRFISLLKETGAVPQRPVARQYLIGVADSQEMVSHFPPLGERAQSQRGKGATRRPKGKKAN